jgi:hypothetical protein
MHAIDERFCDHQTVAGGVLFRLLGVLLRRRVAPLEYPRLHQRRQSRPAVGDGALHAARRGRDLDVDLAAGVRELDGVRQQVVGDDGDGNPIGPHPRQIAGIMAADLDVLLRRAAAMIGARSFDQRLEPHVLEP